MATKSKSGSAKSDKATTKDELKVENVQSDGSVEETETTPVEVNESGAGFTNGKRDEVDPLTSGAPTYGEDIKGASTTEQQNEQGDQFAETKALAMDASDAEVADNGDEDEQDEVATDRVEPGADEDASEEEVQDEDVETSGEAEAEAQGVDEPDKIHTGDL